jgi:hypothetical protein
MQSMTVGNPAAIKAMADPVFAIYRRGISEVVS